jgi:hypothetical protein
MLALETGGMTVLQYDRCGQGDSTGFVLGTPPDYDFAQRESEMLHLLLNLVKVDPENTVLVGEMAAQLRSRTPRLRSRRCADWC